MHQRQHDAELVIQWKDSEIQRNADINSIYMHDFTQHKILVECLQSELAQVKQKAVDDLEKEGAEYERQMQQNTAVYPEAPQASPYTTLPAAPWSAAAQVAPAVATHSRDCHWARLQAISIIYKQEEDNVSV